MDIINHCLTLTPVPGLAAAFSILRFIVSAVRQVQASKQQLLTLTTCAAQLLETLNVEYASGRLPPDRSTEALDSLESLLTQVTEFVQQQTACSFLKSMYTKNERIAQIDAYHRQFGTLVMSFQISTLLNMKDWQARNDSARTKDQDELVTRLDDLEMNQGKLLDALNAQQSNFVAIMASLQRHLQKQYIGERERQFYSSSLRQISLTSGSHAELESWTITSYDVEFGPVIGSGGFGEVFQGTWNKTRIAIKVLKADGGAPPGSAAIRREIDTWSKILHPHVLQFLGANILDDKPFIVMPYLKNGNVRDYIRQYPDCDRLLILHHISLGVAHLHSLNIVHGDLKAMNVLIDDSGKALLCDFGLSRVKADAMSRTTTPKSSNVGSRNWMSPERLKGGSPRKYSDIYAFGMTIFEIYANDIPLGHIDPGDFTLLVAETGVRPERPYEDEAPQMTDAIWSLAEECWDKSPTARPHASSVTDTISNLLSTIIRPRYTKQSLPPSSSPAKPSLSVKADSISNVISSIPASSIHSNGTSVTALPPTPASLVAINSAYTPHLRLMGHTAYIACAALSPDGKRIASGSGDKTLRIWDTKTGEAVVQPIRHRGAVNFVGFSSDSKMVVTSSSNAIHVWYADTGRIAAGPFQQTVNPEWPGVHCVHFSPDNTQIASAANKTIYIMDALNGDLVRKPFAGHSDFIYAIAFSPDGKRIVSGSSDQTILVWDTNTGRVVAGPFRGHTRAVSAIAFSPNGESIVTGSYDKTIIIWDAKKGEILAGPLSGHNGTVFSVAFSANGKNIVSGAALDNSICVWNVASGALLVPPLEWNLRDVISAAFSPDGRRIMVAANGTEMVICIGQWRDL